MLNIRLFPKIVVCLLNSHLRKDANIYNNIVLLGGRLVGIHSKNHFQSTGNSRDIRAIPLPLGDKYKTLPYTNPANRKLEEKRPFFIHRMVWPGLCSTQIFRADSTQIHVAIQLIKLRLNWTLLYFSWLTQLRTQLKSQIC